MPESPPSREAGVRDGSADVTDTQESAAIAEGDEAEPAIPIATAVKYPTAVK